MIGVLFKGLWILLHYKTHGRVFFKNEEHDTEQGTQQRGVFRSPAHAAKLRQGNSFQNKGLRKEAYKTKNWDDTGDITETQSLKHFKVDLFCTQVSRKAKMQ